jgi:hypothetical protein
MDCRDLRVLNMVGLQARAVVVCARRRRPRGYCISSIGTKYNIAGKRM